MIRTASCRGGTRAIFVAATLALVQPGSAQTSQTCEFALAGWLATQVELQEARDDYEACIEARTRACTAEQGRVRLLRERLQLVRNYVDRYCRR